MSVQNTITPRELVLETLGTRGKLPCRVSMIVGSYLSERELHQIYAEDSGILGKLNPMCINFLALNQPGVITHFLSPEGQGAMPAIKVIAQRVYESQQRIMLGKDHGGLVFPMYPEVLAYAMQHAKGRSVVEMGGASGENALLLSLAGATEVVINDISLEELNCCRQMQEMLPADIQGRIRLINGDCLEMTPPRVRLQNRAGVVLARNVFHFFTNEQQAQFLSRVREMLGNDGIAIITANLKNDDEADNSNEVYAAHPDSTSFKRTYCVVTDYANGNLVPKHIFLRFMQVASQNKVSNSFEQSYLYTRDPGQGWQVNKNAFQALDPSIKALVKNAIDRNMHRIKPIKHGGVRVFSNHVSSYSQQNLEKVVMSHGFKVECSFVVSANGHLTSNIKNNGRQLGLVIRNIQ